MGINYIEVINKIKIDFYTRTGKTPSYIFVTKSMLNDIECYVISNCVNNHDDLKRWVDNMEFLGIKIRYSEFFTQVDVIMAGLPNKPLDVSTMPNGNGLLYTEPIIMKDYYLNGDAI